MFAPATFRYSDMWLSVPLGSQWFDSAGHSKYGTPTRIKESPVAPSKPSNGRGSTNTAKVFRTRSRYWLWGYNDGKKFFCFQIFNKFENEISKILKKIKTKKVIRNKKLTWLMNKSFITWKNRQSMVSWRRLVFAWPWRKWTKCRYIWIGSWTNRRISFARWVPRPTFAFPSPGWPSPSGQWTQRERVANLPSTFGSLLSKVPNFQKT